jgi:hypothetical protein
LQIDSQDEDSSSTHDTSIMSTDKDAEGFEQVSVEETGSAADPCVQQPECAVIADALPTTSKPHKEKKIENLSKKPLGPYRRFQRKQNEEELAIMKTLAAAVAAPDSMNSASSLQDEGEDAAFGRYVATEFKDISDKKTKLILKQTITTAIFNAKMNLLKESQHSQLSEQPMLRQQFQSVQLPRVAYSGASEQLNRWNQQPTFNTGYDNENNHDTTYLLNSLDNNGMSYMQLLG